VTPEEIKESEDSDEGQNSDLPKRHINITVDAGDRSLKKSDRKADKQPEPRSSEKKHEKKGKAKGEHTIDRLID